MARKRYLPLDVVKASVWIISSARSQHRVRAASAERHSTRTVRAIDSDSKSRIAASGRDAVTSPAER
jgi:hypothetical protein